MMDKRTAVPFLILVFEGEFPIFLPNDDGGKWERALPLLLRLMRNLNNHFRVNQYTTLKPTISLTRGGVTDWYAHTPKGAHISTGRRRRKDREVNSLPSDTLSESELDRVSDLFVSSDRIGCWMNWKEISFLPSDLQLLLQKVAEKKSGPRVQWKLQHVVTDTRPLITLQSFHRISSWIL